MITIRRLRLTPVQRRFYSVTAFLGLLLALTSLNTVVFGGIAFDFSPMFLEDSLQGNAPLLYKGSEAPIGLGVGILILSLPVIIAPLFWWLVRQIVLPPDHPFYAITEYLLVLAGALAMFGICCLYTSQVYAETTELRGVLLQLAFTANYLFFFMFLLQVHLVGLGAYYLGTLPLWLASILVGVSALIMPVQLLVARGLPPMLFVTGMGMVATAISLLTFYLWTASRLPPSNDHPTPITSSTSAWQDDKL